MATTGILNGTLLGIYVGGTLVSHSTSNSISISHSPRSATSKDSGGWSDNLEGLREWSGEGEAYLALDATYGLNDLVTIMKGRTKVTIRFSTEVTGNQYFEGQAYLDSISADSSPEESATFSYSFTGTGALNYKALT
jgi:predicted secreted protein